MLTVWIVNSIWLVVAFFMVDWLEREAYVAANGNLSNVMKSAVIIMGLLWPLWLPPLVVYAFFGSFSEQ